MSSRAPATALALALVVSLSAAGSARAQEEAPASSPKSKAGEKPTSKKVAAKKTDGKSGVAKKDTTSKGRIAKATFGGGCFWCLEAVFEKVPGVKNVVSGYSGGVVANPTYAMVCTGETGHAEVVRIEYDPDLVSYEKLLDVFWICHDPTSLNAQGPDFGTQYRSVIFFHDDSQKAAALKSAAAFAKSHRLRSPIVTELVPEAPFFAAEAYHQDYYRQHKKAAYCLENVVPKLKKLEKLEKAHAK